MSTSFNLQRDTGGNAAYSPQPSTDLYNGTLASAVVQTVTVPVSVGANALWSVSFSFEPGTSVWVSYDGSSPDISNIGGSIDTTNAELNPASRMVIAGTEIKLVTTDTTADVGIMMYPIDYSASMVS